MVIFSFITSVYRADRGWNYLIIKASQPIVSHGESDTGLRHLAFEVKDVASHEKELRAAGVEITLPTCDLPNLGVQGVIIFRPEWCYTRILRKTIMVNQIRRHLNGNGCRKSKGI